jgi:hypothetical protein
MNVPMLDEGEFGQVRAALRNRSPLRFTERILAKYLEITGFEETNPNAVWHHRIALYGSPCRVCGKPLRTPRAAFCAACGADRSEGGPEAG